MNRLAPSGPGGASQEGFRSEPPLSTPHTRCKHAKALEVILVFQSSLLFYIHSDSPVLSLGFQPRVPLNAPRTHLSQSRNMLFAARRSWDRTQYFIRSLFPQKAPTSWMDAQRKESFFTNERTTKTACGCATASCSLQPRGHFTSTTS